MQARTRAVSVLILLVSAAVFAAYYYFRSQNDSDVLLASGTIEATRVDVAFQIPGKVSELGPDEGDRVEAGAVIARLSSEELSSRVQQLEAALNAITSQVPQQEAALEMKMSLVENQILQARGQADAAQSVVARLRDGARPQEIRVGEAILAQAQAELDRRKADFERLSGLHQREVISQSEFDAAKAAFRAAETGVAAARERLELTKEGPRREEIAEAEARLRAAMAGVAIAESARKEIEIQQRALQSARARVRELSAQLDVARTQFGYTKVQTPIAGIVLLKSVENGEVVSPGTPVLTIGDLDNLWMNLYIPETRIGLVKLNQPTRIRVDSFPDEVFDGHVTFIASEAEFTPKTVQTSEERVRLVYRVKVSLKNRERKLKPGMPADAEFPLNGTP